jgi:hypothetical protein
MRLCAFLPRHATRYATGVLAAVLGAVLLAGCAVTAHQEGHAPQGLLDKLLAKAPPETAAVPAKSEGCGTPAQCKTALKKMVDDPNRGWVGEQQEAAAYTDGTRLFAYRALRKKLSCRELSLALTEVRIASKSLSYEVQGLTVEQRSRTRALSSQVEGELGKERGARCRA